MSYEYNAGLGALGWVRTGGGCRVGGNAGIMRCVPPSEVASARARGAVVQTGQSCSYMAGSTRRTGTKYCFPSEAAAAPAAEPENEESFDSFLDRIAAGAGEAAEAVSSKFTGEVQDTAGKLVGTAAQVAIEEGQAAEDEAIPWQETPEGGDGNNWLQQYMPHITIASTLIGLGTFVIWLAVRNKDKKESRRDYAEGYR